MRRSLVVAVVSGLSVAVALADEKPAPPPNRSTLTPENDWRLAKKPGAEPRKIGVLSYYPNNGGGYTFLEHEHIAFCSLPYMPRTDWIRVDVFRNGQVRRGTTTVFGIIGTSTMPRGGQTFYRSEMKELGASDGRLRVDTPIAKWTRDTPDGQFHLSIIAEDSETRVKLKSIIPVLEHAEHAR